MGRLRDVRSRHGAAVGLRATRARARVAPTRWPRVSPRRALLSLSWLEAVQGEVRPDLGAEVPRSTGWSGASTDPRERDVARVRWFDGRGEEMNARMLLAG